MENMCCDYVYAIKNKDIYPFLYYLSECYKEKDVKTYFEVIIFDEHVKPYIDIDFYVENKVIDENIGKEQKDIYGYNKKIRDSVCNYFKSHLKELSGEDINIHSYCTRPSPNLKNINVTKFSIKLIADCNIDTQNPNKYEVLKAIVSNFTTKYEKELREVFKFAYLEKNKGIKSIIDCSVYKSQQLMRLPYCCKPNIPKDKMKQYANIDFKIDPFDINYHFINIRRPASKKIKIDESKLIAQSNKCCY
jgi:hypothetical protein